MKHGYFVTGTSTGVGKTYVTAALALHARSKGLRVFAFKPIETGCEPTQHGQPLQLGSDQQVLVAAAGGWQTGALAGAYQFEPPVAPSVASRAASIEISVPTILEVLARGSEQADFVLVEGAGGWRVPISATLDMSELARACAFPVLVVATATLGTINHSLLTAQAIERDGQVVAGIILSQHPADDLAMVESNLEQLRSRWSGPILALHTDLTVLDPFVQVRYPAS
ncbi:MAG: dethiobiotin synthase [Kofleriaceae bacterium]